MPRTEEYDYSHGYFTPEPHCIPGYTGYLPGFGPHKLYQYGRTYGRMTHDIMAKHPVAGDRLGRILECSESSGRRNSRPYDCKSKNSDDSTILRSDMVPGYTGHIPRKNFYCGKGYQEECRRGIDDFQRIQLDRQDDRCSYKYIPPDDLLPRGMVFPRRLYERPEHRSIPCYATYTNPMNYGQSVYDMSDLDPRKTYMPGFTGYFTGKFYEMGVTHGRGAHQDLCDLTSSRLERLVAERRPKVSSWYSCPKHYPPVAPELFGYHPPPLEPVKPVPGYAGHIPGYRDKGLGSTYGKSAGAILRERELAEYKGLREP